MAHWDSKQQKIIYWEPVPCKDYPGWEIQDCGCCNGIEWGGDEPIECSRCGGNGVIYHHVKSGADAMYPGGPFVGKEVQG